MEFSLELVIISRAFLITQFCIAPFDASTSSAQVIFLRNHSGCDLDRVLSFPTKSRDVSKYRI